MLVTLSFEEGLAAATKGVVQMMRAVSQKRVGNDHGGASGRDMRERWAQAIHGQMCEEAWSKYRDVYPIASVAGIGSTDPGGVHVRGTPWDGGHLIVNGEEVAKYADDLFVLVVGHWPTLRVAGWLRCRDAARDEWWRPLERPASWWVPQDELRPMEDFRNASLEEKCSSSESTPA